MGGVWNFFATAAEIHRPFDTKTKTGAPKELSANSTMGAQFCAIKRHVLKENWQPGSLFCSLPHSLHVSRQAWVLSFADFSVAKSKVHQTFSNIIRRFYLFYVFSAPSSMISAVQRCENMFLLPHSSGWKFATNSNQIVTCVRKGGVLPEAKLKVVEIVAISNKQSGCRTICITIKKFVWTFCSTSNTTEAGRRVLIEMFFLWYN